MNCGRVLLLAFTTLLVATTSHAFTIDWDTIGWDDTDVSGSQAFNNVDGSDVDILVSYTDNMFGGVPNIYIDGTPSPPPEVIGKLRFTNDRDGILEATTVTIAFSELVFIDELRTLSLSFNVGLQENMIVQAFAGGVPVVASTYGDVFGPPEQTETSQVGSVNHSRGANGVDQEDDEFGANFYSYVEDGGGIDRITFSIFMTEEGGDDIVQGWSSQAIDDVSFRPVPEPATAALLGLGCGGLAWLGRKRLA